MFYNIFYSVYDYDLITLIYLRPDLNKLELYTPIKPLEVVAEEIGVPVEKLVKLDANENLYGPIPEIMDAIAHANLRILYIFSLNCFSVTN